MNIWRNAIAHHDFRFSGTSSPLAGRTTITLAEAKKMYSVCQRLAESFDRTMYREIIKIGGEKPW